MRARSKSRRLGASSKEHATEAIELLPSVVTSTRLARQGTCGIRFTSLEDAIAKMASVSAHAFGSGGKIAKGAFSRKTVSTDTAVAIYAARKDLRRAISEFRSDCIKQNLSGLGKPRKRRKR